MCMRFGSNDGRDFLSTREPPTQKPSTEQRERAADSAPAARSLWREFLEGLYFRRGSGSES